MRLKFINWWNWAVHRPYVLINLSFLLIFLGLFVYLMNKDIDVLENWHVSTTKVKGANNSLPIYYPGGTLEFISTSNKLQSAEGITSRIFDCDATGSARAREISISSVPANRAPGYNAPRENSIVVPSIGDFNGLPRTCRVVFNICYQNVVLWRDHCESARTNDFLVQEEQLDPAAIRALIDELNQRIKNLEDQLAVAEVSPVAKTPQYAPTVTQQEDKTSDTSAMTTTDANSTQTANQPSFIQTLIKNLIGG